MQKKSPRRAHILTCVKLLTVPYHRFQSLTRWCHQMETFSVLLAICAGNSPVTGEFLAQRPETRSFDVFFDLRLHKRLSKQWWSWWFETLSRPLWRQCNDKLCGNSACYIPFHIVMHYPDVIDNVPLPFWKFSDFSSRQIFGNAVDDIIVTI